MLEFDRNAPIDAEILAEFFARCGWQEPDAASKLKWALAVSDEWVVCKVDGQIVGFGRSCRVDALTRVVFDVVVDPRLEHTGLKSLIIRALTDSAGGIEEVSVFEPLFGFADKFVRNTHGLSQRHQHDIYLGKRKAALERKE